MSTPALQLIIFDLDGTLVNSVPDLTVTINYIFSLEGDRCFGEDDVQKMVGSGIRLLVEEAAAKVGCTDDVDDLVVRFKDRYNQNMLEKTQPYEGVVETLDKLDNYKKAVLSNKIDMYTKKVVAGVGIADRFDLIRGADTGTYASKPSPEGIQYILDKLGVEPQHALIIGDSTHDIHAGKAAGLRTVSVTYGYRSREVLKQAEPDYIVDHMTELVGIVEQLSE